MHTIMSKNEKKIDGASLFPSVSRTSDESIAASPVDTADTKNCADHSKLASMLRECATYVERNQFHPIIYGALGALHAYAGEKASSSDSPEITSSASFDMKTNGVGSRAGKKPEQTNQSVPDRPSAVLRESSTSRTMNENEKANENRTVAKDAHLAAAHGQSHSGIHIGISSLSKKVWGTSKKEEKTVLGGTDAVEWCEEHFVMGCTCKAKSQKREGKGNPNPAPPETEERMEKHKNKRPSFQRPINSSSNLIANGWIEQQRRSKMRIVWKDVLASLVEGRKSSEETTLWIQRQVINASGQAELEALHQIPMKWVEDISYLDFYGDHRFAIKVYNFHDEFHFRCGDESSAMNWVSTLRHAREVSTKREGRPGEGPSIGLNNLNLDDLNNGESKAFSQSQPQPPLRQAQSTQKEVFDSSNIRLTVKELQAIAHGFGVDTRGMERKDLEAIAIKHGQIPSIKVPSHNVQNVQNKSDTTVEDMNKKSVQHKADEKTTNVDDWRKAPEKYEKEEAERRLKEQQAKDGTTNRQHEDMDRRRKQEEMERRRLEDMERRRQQDEIEMRRQQEEMERRRQQEEMERRRLKEEMEQRRLKEEMERRRQQEEMERRRQQEEMERRRQHEEMERKRKEQSAKETDMRRQQAAAEHYRRQQQEAALSAAAEQRRQEEYRRRQETIPDPRQFQHSQQAWQQPNFPQQQHSLQQRYYAQQKKQQQSSHPAQQQNPFSNVSNGTGTPQPPPPPPPQQNSRANENGNDSVKTKYAKAMSEDAEQAAITAIKRNILITWALLPPMLQNLRPIDQLVCTVHRVFPPAFGVPGHEYFQKWKPISSNELQLNHIMGNTPNEEKLKKAVKKIRFFLHPDKLPRDLNIEQEFMCKMLWDVTSDAWEEFCTNKEELDWVK